MCELLLKLSLWALSWRWLRIAQVSKQRVASSSSHRCGQQITQKHRHLSTRPHGFISKQYLIFIVTTQKENISWNAGRRFYRNICVTASRQGRSVSEYRTIRYNCRPHTRFEVPVAVTTQIACAFCDPILQSLEGIYRYFGRNVFLTYLVRKWHWRWRQQEIPNVDTFLPDYTESHPRKFYSLSCRCK